MQRKIVKNISYIFIDGIWINERSNIILDPHDPDYSIVWGIIKNDKNYE
tara:strand:- start:4385 stop:4531 length:147 start_codon:yes stop_codon:yes gene_type:complete